MLSVRRLSFCRCDHGVAAALAAGAGHSEHHAHGQSLLHGSLAAEEVPEIALVRYAGGYGLRGVDDGAAAYGQQTVYVAVASEAYAFVHEGVDGVWPDAAQFYHVDADGFERHADAVEQSVGLYVFLTVDYHHALGAREKRQHAGLFFGASAELKQCRGVVGEIVHNVMNVFVLPLVNL